MRFAFVAAVAAAALAAPATAGAAGWNGVVIAKDSAREAVVTASARGVVRTLRAPGGFARLRVGQRVAVTAVALGDGTFRARSVRVAGRGAKARVRGVLVRHQRALGRYLISSGGSVVVVRAGAARKLAAANGDLQPGDKLDLTVEIQSGGSLASSSVRSTGQTSVLELEGIFTGLAGSALQLAVARRGLISVAVPAGFELPALAPGDEIELAVSVGAGGSFTLVALDADDEDTAEGIETDDDGEVEVEGTISSLSPLTVAGVTCGVPAGVALSGFAVGDRVEMTCEQSGGQLMLTKLKAEADQQKAEDQDEHEDEHEDD